MTESQESRPSLSPSTLWVSTPPALAAAARVRTWEHPAVTTLGFSDTACWAAQEVAQRLSLGGAILRTNPSLPSTCNPVTTEQEHLADASASLDAMRMPTSLLNHMSFEFTTSPC